VIYLIMEMVLYLACALCLGVVAGWLWRNVQAAAVQDALERQLMDARSRLPPVEHALRSHEERLREMTLELAGRNETLSLRNREIEGLERVCADLRALVEAQREVADDGRVAALESDLELARAALVVERRRVEGLLRERDLQHAALRALEQRLELAKLQ
jgi:uncharacterized protein HemX